MQVGGASSAMQETREVQPRGLTDQELEAIARVCHEANRAYCLMLGDASQPEWNNAPDWQRESARNGVRQAVRGHGGYRVMNEDEERHNSWLEEKLRAGWTYGPTKDPERKRHPCMLPYASLPPEQRRKDVLFGAICSALDPRRTV